MELKSLVCPHCGANTTNTQNCEYCGSLFVRFVDKGIDIRNTSYLSDTYSFPDLLPQLKKNLALQETVCGMAVGTDILWIDEKVKEAYGSVLICNNLRWADNSEVEGLADSDGLKINVDFSLNQNNGDSEFNKTQEEKLARFKNLLSFPLFKSHICTIDNMIVREYAINFGKDAEGAAKLVSEILIQVYGLKPTDKYDIYTEKGSDYLYQAHDAWLVAHGFEADSDLQVARIFGIILGVISPLVMLHWISNPVVMIGPIGLLGYGLYLLWKSYRLGNLSNNLKFMKIMAIIIILGYLLFFIL